MILENHFGHQKFLHIFKKFWLVGKKNFFFSKKKFFSKALFYGYLRYGNHLQGMLRGLHDVFVEKISGVRNFFMCSKITFENYKIFKITTLFIWEKGYSSTLKRVSNFGAKYSSNIYTNHISVAKKILIS